MEIEKLAEILERQNFHFQPGYWGNFPEEFESSGRPISISEQKEWAKKVDENERKVIEAVKLYLKDTPFAFTATIRAALGSIDGAGHIRPGSTHELLSIDEGAKTILYNWEGGHAMAILPKPTYNGRVANKYFHSDLQIGFMTVSAGLEEVVRRDKIEVPTEIQLVKGESFPGLPSRLKFDGKGRYIGNQAKSDCVVFLDYDSMAISLSKELQARRADKTGTSHMDLFHKLPTG